MSKIYQKGLTLAEMLLAAAILAFAISGMLILFINCAFLNEGNRNLTVAVTHAQFIMEEIRDSAFATLEPAITNGDWDWGTFEIGSHNLALLPNEAIDTNVFQSGNPLGVSVRVDWQDGGRRNRNTELRTLTTNY